MITFNIPYLCGSETEYIGEAAKKGHLSGNGHFTALCQTFLENSYGFRKALLTTSCTDALEMCAMLIDIKPGDEVIVPSYTFVSTALAFARQGAKIVFADSKKTHPCIDEDLIEPLITSKTRAIVPVHYAGIACNMNKIMDIAGRHNLFVVEDAAQAIDSYYLPGDHTDQNSSGRKVPLGSIGHLAVFSFHETKNIHCGEGGALLINDEQFIRRAEIIWEKGTNRSSFFRGEVNKYGWVDTGSSFLPSEINAAFLWAQLQNIHAIQQRRREIWRKYYALLKHLPENTLSLPFMPDYATNNGHMFYLLCPDQNFRDGLLEHFKKNDILAIFHYQSLHSSSYYSSRHDGRELPQSERYSSCLIRLPFFNTISDEEIKRVCDVIKSYL